MKEYQIHIDDLQRIFIGEANLDFYIEVIIRTIIIYLILIVSMRLLGQRMASQLSRIEMAAMVSLAAAIGVPLQTPERGLLPAVIIALVVVCVARVISYYSSKNQKFEDLSQDHLDILVEDSVMNIPQMKRTRITRERLFAQLRSEGITNLGAVRRLYFEANGSFSLIKNIDPKPGLCILPDWDRDFVGELEGTEEQLCLNCGKEKDAEREEIECFNCGESKWVSGVTDNVIHYNLS
jgi:uncharacterized membrane protein YcaP (DUF421 family)